MRHHKLGRLLLWAHRDKRAYRQYGVLIIPVCHLWGLCVEVVYGRASLKVGVVWEKR